jgi:hypothetical protein
VINTDSFLNQRMDEPLEDPLGREAIAQTPSCGLESRFVQFAEDALVNALLLKHIAFKSRMR